MENRSQRGWREPRGTVHMDLALTGKAGAFRSASPPQPHSPAKTLPPLTTCLAAPGKEHRGASACRCGPRGSPEPQAQPRGGESGQGSWRTGLSQCSSQCSAHPLAASCSQVDEVFALPLAHLLQVQNQGYTHFCRGGHFGYTMPVFLHGPHRVWGMTAIITELTLQLLAPGAYQPRLHFPGFQPRA